MSQSFADLGVPADLVARLSSRGIESPFPIQVGAIPAGLAGKDVCGKAPTGSGKTLAFGIPLVTRVAQARPRRPRALVLAPTRELAAQIEGELTPLAALRSRSVAAFYGGVGFGAQLSALRRGVDIVVACPGRLADLVARGDIRLDEVEIVVIDEADRMADMGFLPEVKRLLDQVRTDRQTLLFSATLDGDVDVLVKRYQRNPVRSEVKAAAKELDLTEHAFWAAAREQRTELTVRAIEHHGTSIVFCRTKRGADRLTKQLGNHGVTAAAFHGDRSQQQRERALAAFMAGRVQALVATDVAARGIHVDEVGVVVHHDLPADHKDYVHRSGRTGRAGATGAVIALVLPEQAADAKKLQRKLGMAPGIVQPLPPVLVDGAPKVRAAVRNDVVPGPALKGRHHNPSKDQRRTRKPTGGPGRQGAGRNG
ncbi:MAG: DEAD/DEAH box helicase, partial [Acidimicrobiales bacterium]